MPTVIDLKKKAEDESKQVFEYLQRVEGEAAKARARLQQLQGKLEAYTEQEAEAAGKDVEKAAEGVAEAVERPLRKVVDHAVEKPLKK